MAQPARFPPFRDPSVTFGSEGVCQVENLTSFRTPDLHFPPSVAPLRKVSEMTPKRVSEYFPKCVSDFAEIRRRRTKARLKYFWIIATLEKAPPFQGAARLPPTPPTTK